MFFFPNLIFLISTLSRGFAATLWLRGTTHTESFDVHVKGSGWFCRPLWIKSSMAIRTPPMSLHFPSPCNPRPAAQVQWRVGHHNYVRTRQQLCRVFSSLKAEHSLSRKFCPRNVCFLAF